MEGRGLYSSSSIIVFEKNNQTKNVQILNFINIVSLTLMDPSGLLCPIFCCINFAQICHRIILWNFLATSLFYKQTNKQKINKNKVDLLYD